MKVLFITHYANLYGANLSLLYLIEELKSYGVAPLVISPKEGPFTEKLREHNIEYRIMNMKSWVSAKPNIIKGIVKYILNHFYALQIMRVILKEEVVLVHTNSSVTPVGAIAAKFLRKKHIWHVREFLEEDYHLYFELGKKISLKILNNLSDKIVFISNSLLEKYKFNIEEKKSELIYNGVKDIYGTLQKNRKVNEHLELVIVGTLIKSKGQDLAIKAIDYLLKEKGIKCILNIVGDGPYRSELEKLVEELKLSQYVKFWGYQSDVSRIYNYCDISLVCSEKEAFGRVTIEAMLASLPVIGSDSGATSEIIIDNNTGLLYKCGNYIDLANKILFFHKNRDKIFQFGENGRKRAIKYFLSSTNALKIYRLYKELT